MSSDPTIAAPRSVKQRPKILAFHKLTPKVTYGATNFSPRRFGRLLAYLGRRRLKLETLANVLTAPSEDTLAITFDDAYAHLIDSLPPIMEAHHFEPTVFVPTDFVGAGNSWDYSSFLRSDPHLSPAQIRELAAQGVRFGTHGATHVDLTRCSPDRLVKETRDAKQRLEDILGSAVDGISYPFGRHNQIVRAAVAEAGYRYGLGMNFPTSDDDDLGRGRYAVYFYDTQSSVRTKLMGGRWYAVEKLKASVTNRLSQGTVLLNALLGRERH